MKITIESTEWEIQRTAFVSTANDDLYIVDLLELIADAIKAFGYSEETVRNAMFPEDN